MNNEILFKPNSLIMATSNTDDITSSEYKLFDTLLQRCQYNNGYGWRSAEVSRNEIKDIIKSNDNRTVKSICETLDKFRDITLKFKLDHKYVNGSAIAEYVYDENTDLFTCVMSENVFNILINYAKHGYSPIDLQIVRRTKSYYTQKIYGLLRAWSRTNVVVIKSFNLEEIKNICDIFEGTSYDTYKEFKRRVLIVSLNEICQKLNMDVTFKEIKVMRKVNKIEFTILDREPRKYDFIKDKLIESKEIITQGSKSIDNMHTSDIDSIDYMYLLDFKLNESIHNQFLSEFSNYKEYIACVHTASEKTIIAVGGKTINKRNYEYFKTTLKNLIPSLAIIQ